MEPKYEVTSKIVNPWFGKPYVLYTLTKTTKEWDDPSYGNGGGSYEDHTVGIFSSKTLSEVHTMQNKLEIIP